MAEPSLSMPEGVVRSVLRPAIPLARRDPSAYWDL